MTESSFALYRKYRPDSFASVRNQDHIVSVLEGAIRKGTIPHALLFTGSRGTGKTTVARIFAHAIGAHDIDIYEIDAASNRGIDDIRTLKEAVHTLPYESPYKVYIIDEVHMLTKEAWNALLKTLEEPPAYVVFILATTEQDKILDTILSRCQVFTFRSPSARELTELILDIAQRESVIMTEAGARVIALAANGSYRDALSIMQKVLMVSSDRELDADEISEIVGAPHAVRVRDFLAALHGRDVQSALTILREVEESHTDIKIFSALVLERLRTILLVRHRAMAESDLTSFYEDERALIMRCAQDATSPIHSALLLRFLEAHDRIGYSHIKTLPIELAVVESL